MKKLKNERDPDTTAGVDDSVSEKGSEHEQLIRKAPPRSQSRNRKKTNNDESDIKNEHNFESPRNKPPIDSRSSSRINSSQNIRNEDRPEPKRKIRSRSISKERSVNDNGHVNEAYDSDASVSRRRRNSKDSKRSKDTNEDKKTDDEAKKSEKNVKKRKKKTKKEEVEKIEDPRVLAVVVHESGKLRTDINIYHPMVRIHILDLDQDGRYIKKLHKDRNVSFYHEKENTGLDYIAPIMTTPFDFKVHKSLIPKWEEIIVFNESFNHFTQDHPNVLIMFEILDTMKISKALETYSLSGKQSGYQRIAWAFLKLVGSDKTLNIEKKIRLQLYYSQDLFRQGLTDDLTPEIYNLYKSYTMIKYPSTLTVTVKSVLPPKKFAPCLRSFYVFQEEKPASDEDEIETERDEETMIDKNNIDETDNASMTMLNTRQNAGRSKQGVAEKSSVIWSRLAGQPCRIPNDLFLTLPSGKNGCYSIRFSKSGSYLACASVEENNISPILIYEIPDGKLSAKFIGHFGLIYELDWSKYDKYLLTASNDATSRVFDMTTKSKDSYKILPHPTFVYTAKFNPNSEEIICTAGYDKVIRVWSIERVGQYGLLLQELAGHMGYINSICFSFDGLKLYSADSVGNLLSWNSSVTSGSYGKEGGREWKKESDIIIEDLANQCINYIEIHPNQRRMIVQTRNNQLRLIDIRIQAVISRYEGALTFNDFTKSTLSPCGTFLFTSGADTKAYAWNVETGDLVTTIGINLSYLKQAKDSHYHPFDHMIAFCSFGPHSPIYVFKYDIDKAAKYLTEGKIQSLGTFTTKPPIPTVTLNQTLDLPNLINSPSDELISVQDRTSKDQLDYNSDIDRLHPSQTSSRFRKVHDQIDSVYASIATLSTVPKKSVLKKDEIDVSRINFNSSMTLSMKTAEKPEFKYNGPKETQDMVIALYDYTAQRSDELDLLQGDEIFVLVRDSPSWWMGELVKNRKQGYFPSSYVQEKKNHNNGPKLTVKDVMTKYNSLIEEPIYSKVNKDNNAPKVSEINEIPTRDRPNSASIRKKPGTAKRTTIKNQTEL